MVIPSLILPTAGSASSAQPGGSAAAGQVPGLFAALLAALQGVVEGGAPAFAQSEGESGQPLTTLLDGSAVEAEADTTELVDAEAAAAALVADAGAKVAVPATVVPEAKPVSAKQTPVASTASTETNALAKATANAATAANAETVKPVQQPANVVPLKPATAPAEAIAPPPQAPATPSVPVPTPEVSVKPVATQSPTPQAATPPPPAPSPEAQVAAVPAPPEPETPTANDVKASAPRVTEPDVRIVQSTTDKPSAPVKPEADAEPAKGFEKVRPLIEALRASEESAPLRKGVEAFTKPVAGQSESAAHIARPQSPVIVPVAVSESTNAPVADVTKVTASIAPAETGSDAPRSVASPDAPEKPVRSTLPDLAQTAVRSVRYLARNGEHRMSIRLIPESLGEVHIEVHATKDAMTVKLIAERGVVRDAMEAHAHLLRDSLSQEGIEVKSITVSDDSGSGRGAQYQRDAHASRHGERGQSQSNHQPAPDQSSGRNAKNATPRARHDGAFDQVA